VPLGVLGPALVWRIVWLPWVAVGVAVPEPRRWVCWWGGIVVCVPVVGVRLYQCIGVSMCGGGGCPFDGIVLEERGIQCLERARRDGKAK